MGEDFPCRDDLPGEPISVWLANTREDDPPANRLTTDRTVDVCVIGAGIAGLSTAIELRDRGQSVAVIERDRVATGVTGKSTAKLTSQHGLIYDHLRREFGRRQASQYATVQEESIDAVETRIDELGIDCAFERQPAYLYSNSPDEIEREADAARGAGIDASYVTSVTPFERAAAAVRFEDQAWFDPRSYLLAIADELRADDGAGLFEETRVTEVEPGQPCHVRTDRASVTADQVVVATGFPILDRGGFFARMHPKRSYVLAIRLDGQPPEGMYYRSSDTYRSVRTHRGEETYLLVGGENHKTGQGSPTADRYRRLARWAHERFPVDEIVYRWSTQDYTPADKVPFIGRAGPGADGVFVATGFRGWGMTNGVTAGRLLAAEIAGDRQPAAELFDPLRFTPKQSFGDTVTENVDAASEFLTDWTQTLFTPDRSALNPGEGHVVREGGKPIARAKDEDGDVHAVSAVCSHMYCLVEWNDGECSWDCPCHGSRFAPDGEVLEGPANEGLSDPETGPAPRED